MSRAPRREHVTALAIEAEYAPDRERMVKALLVLLGHAPTTYAVIEPPTPPAAPSPAVPPAREAGR